MSEPRQQKLQTILLQLLPADHSAVGNIALWAQFQAAADAAGIAAITEDTFKIVREALVESGQAIKGKGRGGSTARATGPNRPDFDLTADPSTPDLLAAPPIAKPGKSVKPKAAPQATPPGDPQVLSYRHADRRKNNPEVGLVNEASDPEQPKTTWAYDPHLDPVLQWTGKAERTSFEVDTVSLHVHERIDAMSILSAVSKRQGAMKQGAAHAISTAATGQKGINSGLNHSQGFQPGLFEAPFESLPLRSAIDFYKHDRGWANRLIVRSCFSSKSDLIALAVSAN